MIPETTRTTIEAQLVGQAFPMRRPRTLAACARIGARRYRRRRDLPGAVRGLLAGDESAILPRLIAEEQRCETARRERTADYRPAQHVQILAALLAEAAAACPDLADGAEAPRTVSPGVVVGCEGQLPCHAAARPPLPTRPMAPTIRQVRASGRQAKASGSEPLRSAI